MAPVFDTYLLDDVRSAFADGRNADGEALLLRALDHGVPWDLATRAVALGVERCFQGDRFAVAAQ